jgi:hypothetical protein
VYSSKEDNVEGQHTYMTNEIDLILLIIGLMCSIYSAYGATNPCNLIWPCTLWISTFIMICVIIRISNRFIF